MIVNRWHNHTRFTALFQDHPGELVPENFWTLWCKGRLTEADTPSIRLGTTPSGLTCAHLHPPHFFTGRMPFLPPSQQCQSTEGNRRHCVLSYIWILFSCYTHSAVSDSIHFPPSSAVGWAAGRASGPSKNMGGWWRWALLSPDGVAPSQMVGVPACVNLLLYHEVQKFPSGTGSPGWSRKKSRKTVVVPEDVLNFMQIFSRACFTSEI